ncbi:MAG TPA: serine/threonine-protein kinase [Pyrinomonadaceae bacterium]|jgi:serine/threonine-protein kinase
MQWQKIEEVFDAALDVAPAERRAWLLKHWAHDAELCREVESLLAAEAESSNFLSKSNLAQALGLLLSDAEEAREGQRMGRYRIVREIGRGGMGVVYLAVRDDDQFRQTVAVKVVKRGLDTEEILRRFRNERQILASLSHKNIARLLDGDESEDGRPYFVMEYVEGLPLLKYCDEHGLSVTERLQIFRRICSAVQHAHQNLIIHRDLKPSNILVTEDGEPKLLDFGVAKLLNPEFAGESLTETHAFRVMTPEYASPEQVRGLHVTTATDIYSLGVVLYELLTGVRPYKLKDSSPAELSRAICDSEPSKPSDAASGEQRSDQPPSSDSDGRKTETRPEVRNAKALRGDLDNIVLKALRKEPERRYKSVEQFSEDIRRHLEGLPVSARKDTFTYRASKFISRHKQPVAAASLIILAIIASLIIALWQAEAARKQRDLAQHERLRAERINQFLQRMLSFSNQSLTSVSPVAQRRDVTVNEMLDQIAPQVEAELADQPEVRAQVLRTIGSAYASQGQYEAAERNLRAALEAQVRLYGEENADAAATMTELGVLSYRQGKLEEASRLLEKAVAFYRKQGQAHAPESSAAQLALALDYWGVVKFYQGDTNASFSLLNEALRISTGANLQGRERRVLIFNKSDLGGALVSLGDFEKGEPLLLEAAAEYRQIPGPPPWELGSTLMMLGVAALNQGRLDEADKYLLESEGVLRHTLGDQNGYLAQNLDRQAALRFRRNDLKAAEEKARQSLTVSQAFSPHNNLLWAAPMWTLGDILMKGGRAREAEDYYRQALAIFDQQAKKNYTYLVSVKIRLSQSLVAQGRLPEAGQVAREARDDAQPNLGAESPLTKAATDNLAAIYEKQRKGDEARSLR